MSSWIPSLFNPFTDDDNPTPTSPQPRSPSAGVKDDLTAVKDDLTAAFRGVAAFLAPPPAASSPGPSSSSDTIAGIKSDLAEIQGTFRSGLSLISSKITSNILQLQNQLNDGDGDDNVDEDEEEEGLGINDEILDFVLKISRRPELWTDFPLSLPDDFHLSDYQREHAANIDHLVPEFETLRQEISSQMSDGKFWLIYFILLLPRLNEEDLKLLSTPQVAEARETLVKELHNKTDEETSEKSELSDAKDASDETVNPTVQRKTVDETEIESGDPAGEVDTHPSSDAQKQSLNEEDVSFSDLEDEDPSDKVSAPRRASSGDKAWVQLDEDSGSEGAKHKADHNNASSKDKESEGEDWLTVDDTDFDSLGAV